MNFQLRSLTTLLKLATSIFFLAVFFMIGTTQVFSQGIKGVQTWDKQSYAKYLEKSNPTPLVVVFATANEEGSDIYIALDNNRDGIRDALFSLVSLKRDLVVDIKVKNNNAYVLTIDGSLSIFDLTGEETVQKYDGLNLGACLEILDNDRIIGTGFDEKLITCTINKKTHDLTLPRADKLSDLGASGARSLKVLNGKLFFPDFSGGIKSATINKDGRIDQSTITNIFGAFFGVDLDLDQDGNIYILEPEQFYGDGSRTPKIAYVIRKNDPTFAKVLFIDSVTTDGNFNFLTSIATTKDGKTLFMSSSRGLTILLLDDNKNIVRGDVFVDFLSRVTAIAISE